VEGALAGAKNGLINRERFRALGSDPLALRSIPLYLKVSSSSDIHIFVIAFVDIPNADAIKAPKSWNLSS
jgi:hypothetical protein